MKRVMDTLFEDLRTFIIISRSFLLTMRNISDNSCKETENSHFRFDNIFFYENGVIYDLRWKNIQPDGLHINISYMAHACCFLYK
jgi:hypothetical protein